MATTCVVVVTTIQAEEKSIPLTIRETQAMSVASRKTLLYWVVSRDLPLYSVSRCSIMDRHSSPVAW